MAEYFHTGHVPVAEVIRPRSGERPRMVLCSDRDDMARRVANWYRSRGGPELGVGVVGQWKRGEDLYAKLRSQLSDQRVQFYTSYKKNENSIDLLASGITILNVQSIKGQEFDTVFLTEVDQLLVPISEQGRRRMYMLCARARDNLIVIHIGDSVPCALLEQLPAADVLERP